VKSLWLALCVIVPADLLRFQSPRFERTYERVLGFLMRESEKVLSHRTASPNPSPKLLKFIFQNSTNGVVWYILGVNFVLSFYPRDVATVAILM
jgi:diacylglycerol kinase (CTP)